MTTKEELIVTGYRLPSEHTEIKERQQLVGPPKWSVSRLNLVLNKKGKWEYEPSPSNRDASFLIRCRFSSVEEALDAFNNKIED